MTSAASSGFNGITVLTNVDGFFPFVGPIIPGPQPLPVDNSLFFANRVNDFVSGKNLTGIIGVTHVGTPSIATTATRTTDYLVRAALERNISLTLPDGGDFDLAQPGAATTLVARDETEVTVVPGFARVTAALNPSTGFFQVILAAEGQTPVFGALFNPASFATRLERFGPYELPIEGDARLFDPIRSIVTSAALSPVAVVPGAIVPINEVTVTAIDFGLPSAVANLRIINRFHELEGRDLSGRLVYAGYYELELLGGESINGYLAQGDYVPNLVYVNLLGGQPRLVWAVPSGISLDASLVNATTVVLGTQVTTALDGLLVARQGVLRPTIVAVTERIPRPCPRPEPRPCPKPCPKPYPKPEPKPCPRPKPCEERKFDRCEDPCSERKERKRCACGQFH